MAEIINFQEAKQALELRAVKREYLRETAQKAGETPPRPTKKIPLVVSALPGEAIPPEYPDLRPYLQRDGLILLSWAKWNDPKKGPCYRVNWATSCGNLRRYSSGTVYDFEDEKQYFDITPVQRGDQHYREGVFYLGTIIADVIFLAAPDLSALTRPLFVQKLKEMGLAVNFDFEFSLGLAKELEYKKQIEQIEALKGAQNG